jgi:hypothetical protein
MLYDRYKKYSYCVLFVYKVDILWNRFNTTYQFFVYLRACFNMIAYVLGYKRTFHSYSWVSQKINGFSPTIYLIATSFQCAFLHSHPLHLLSHFLLSIFAVLVFCYFTKAKKSLSCWQRGMCSVNKVGEETAGITPTTYVHWEAGIPDRDKRLYSSL